MPRQKQEKSGTGICHVMQGKESKTCPSDSLGVASGGLIRLNDRSATTLAHEIGHTLGLTDSYGHGNGHGEGIMGSPPTTLLPSEVDKIWEKAYERKK